MHHLHFRWYMYTCLVNHWWCYPSETCAVMASWATVQPGCPESRGEIWQHPELHHYQHDGLQLPTVVFCMLSSHQLDLVAPKQTFPQVTYYVVDWCWCLRGWKPGKMVLVIISQSLSAFHSFTFSPAVFLVSSKSQIHSTCFCPSLLSLLVLMSPERT